MIKSLLTEYGLRWTVNRLLYSAKLRMMAAMPTTEKLYEKKIDIKRIDIFSFETQAIKDFLKELNEEKKAEIVMIADKAIDGIITGFSSIELDYGNPIRWHYNPITGIESSRDDKWYRIPDFDTELGDIKAVWEASRFTHFLYFVRAYLLTSNKKYYEAFSVQLEHWLKSNTYSCGANYKCGQECTLRMINALMAYTVFKDSRVTTDKDEENITKLVEGSYKKVLSNFFYAHNCIRNNHTFSEICGLIIGAWCCKDEVGVRKAYKLLDREIEHQFLSDGGFTQYSFNYQRFTLQLIECIYKVSEKTGCIITQKERVKNSVLLMYQVQDESGDVPNYGSNDGALIFPVTACGYRDFRPVLNTVYALIEGKRLYKPGDYDEELLWFGGEKASVVDIKRMASAFHDAGFYTLRHDRGFLMTCLQHFTSRPAHMDQLHIDLWHKGVNMLCDSGTYSYANELGKELTSTKGHNAVKLAGVEQMNKRGAFMVLDWIVREDVMHNGNDFSGTMISKNGYKHKRTINKTSQGYVILDEVNGNGEYCEFYFHTPCEAKLIPGGFELLDKGSLICVIKANSKDIVVKKAYRSVFYLKDEEISCVTVGCSMIDNKCSVVFDVKLAG